ncbi:MAG: Translation factor pelota [Thelocarpon superellum]|nr:MAG: Translation factor pelota [Thelocarpon superellum]
MRILKKSLDRDGSGSVTLLPEEPEDMWHAYNLIRPRDQLLASALRRVTTESSTGSTSSTRIHTTFLITVQRLDFDSQAAELHISGIIAAENAYTKVGAHHTLDLTLSRPFTLSKAEGWDSVALEALHDATDPTKRAEVVAVVMQEGLANICLITEHQTILRQRVEATIPRKRAGRAADHDKGLAKFFALVLSTLLRHADVSNSASAVSNKPVLLASPGFTAASFLEYTMNHARESNDRALLAQKKNFIVVHSSSGHVHALNEVLQSPEVLSRLKDTKYARETRYMEQFLTMLRKDDGRAWYGPREVERAVEKGAVGRGGGVLLVSNALFRSHDVGARRRWVRLVDAVKAEGGDARVLSSMHESGQRLEALGGIAALLTFPLEDLDDEDEEDDEGEEGKREEEEQGEGGGATNEKGKGRAGDKTTTTN